MQKFIILFLVNILLVCAQTKDANLILESVKENFNKIKDYQVDVKVKVDVDFIKMPDTDAKIYFKQPNKVHLKSERFAMVPKEGLDFSPLGFIKGKYSAMYIKDEKYNGFNTSVIKVIPEDEGDIILTTLWVDQMKNIIRKVETNSRTAGKMLVEFTYSEKIDYPLPSQMIFSFNTDKLNSVRGLNSPNEEMTDNRDQKQRKKRETTGKVLINYSNYIINSGIPDSIFEEKKK